VTSSRLPVSHGAPSTAAVMETPAATAVHAPALGPTRRRVRSGGGNGSGPQARGDDEQVLGWIVDFCRRRDALANSGEDLQAAAALGELKARIAHAHTALVESIARRFLGSGEPLDDLVQEGFLGLLSALENYNPTHGAGANGSGRSVKFSTYATHFVAGSIRHFLRDRGKIIKEPAWLHEVSTRINRMTDLLTQKLGRAPEPAEIAAELNLTTEAVEEILSTRQTFQVAAFQTSADEDEGGSLGLVNPEKIRSDRYVTLQLPIEDKIVLQNAIAKLKDLEQHVLLEFFYQDLSQTEIARKFGISCNYVSHIIKNATGKLRRVLGEAEVRDRHRARETSLTDPVTGLFQEEHALRRGEEEISRIARAGQPAAVLLVDVAGLPQGGLRREQVWGILGAALRKSIRRIDIAGRMGQDRVLLVLPHTTAEQAQAVAVRLEDVLVAAAAASGEHLVVRVAVALYPEQARSLPRLLAIARSVLAAHIPGGEGAPATESLAS